MKEFKRKLKQMGFLKEQKCDLAIEMVGLAFSESPSDIRGKSRRRNVTDARFVAMFMMKESKSMTLSEIGNYFSGRDHTTVLNALDNVEYWIQSDLPLGKKARFCIEEARRVLTDIDYNPNQLTLTLRAS